MEEKSFRKTLPKKVKLIKMSNFTFFHNVFYAILSFKSFNSHILVVIFSLFNLGRSQNGVLGNWLNKAIYTLCYCSVVIHLLISSNRQLYDMIMYHTIHVFEPCLVTRGFSAFAQSMTKMICPLKKICNNLFINNHM